MATRKTRDELDQEMDADVQQPPPALEEPDISPAPEAGDVSPEPDLATEGTVAEEAPEEEAPEEEAPEEEDTTEPETEIHVPAQLSTIVESLLFAYGDPVSVSDLLKVAKEFQPDLTSRELKRVIEQMRVNLREQGRGIRIVEVADGYQLRTPSEAAPYVKKLVSRRPPRLTRATLETLAIVAYRQPATRGDVEEIRGVDSGAVLKHLLDKKLVKILGRKEEPGRPLVYGTTKEFLSFFSLRDLGSLPTLRDFAELSEEHRASLGLEPITPEEEQAGREELEDALKAEFTDAYAPIGEDEVVQELADAISDLRKRDREIRQALPSSAKKPTEDEKEASEGGPSSASPESLTQPQSQPEHGPVDKPDDKPPEPEAESGS